VKIARREFLAAAAAMAVSGAAMAQRKRDGAAAATASKPLIMDAMGEIRRDYDAALLAEIAGSGLNAITITLSDPKLTETQAFDHALAELLAYDEHIRKHPQQFLKATSVMDIDRARSERRLALFYLFQNSAQFGRDLGRVDLFYSLGVRSAQLTYNHQNWAGAGCKERTGAGLSVFGLELVEKMNQVGMLIDLSHANMQTMADAIAASKRPVIVSHTACTGVFQNVRNTSDENLRALADRGGVVGICQIRPFLTTAREGALAAYFKHIDHAVQVAGIDHVAIGSDRDHRVIAMTDAYVAELKREEGANFHAEDWPLFIDELNGPRRMEVIVAGLGKLGYSQGNVEKILGGNVYRLYKDVIG
jgi:membrane dipeptidase